MNSYEKSSDSGLTRSTSALRPLQVLQLDYWTAFAKHLQQGGSFINPPSAQPQNWMAFRIAHSYCKPVTQIDISDKSISTGIVVIGPDRFTYFHQLIANKAAIEEELRLPSGTEMIWGEFRDKKICRIKIIPRHMDPGDVQTWPEQHEWLRKNLEAVHRAFAPHVESLVL